MTSSSKYADWDTEQLIFNLIDEQHTLIRSKLKYIEGITEGLKMNPGPDLDNLLEFWSRLDLFLLELQLHIIKEESSIFPDILRLWKIRNEPEKFPDYKENFINYQVNNLRSDHERVKDDLSYFLAVTSNFSSLRDSAHLVDYLSRQLKELELILLPHLNIEDRILYPRAIKLESVIKDEVNKIKKG